MNVHTHPRGDILYCITYFYLIPVHGDFYIHTVHVFILNNYSCEYHIHTHIHTCIHTYMKPRRKIVK